MVAVRSCLQPLAHIFPFAIHDLAVHLQGTLRSLGRLQLVHCIIELLLHLQHLHILLCLLRRQRLMQPLNVLLVELAAHFQLI